LASRVAVISDVHANWHALEAVLGAVEEERPDEVWCLGDLVGYGPRPNPCCEAVAARADLCLVGNHDLGVLGDLDLLDFAPDAVESARWTRGVLTAEARSFLESLEPRATREGVELFHASPRDPVWEYVLTVETAASAFELTEAPLVLVGHSHIPLALALEGRKLDGGHAPEGTEAQLDGERRLLNPGSVGQPRDGDPRAAWLLLDFASGRASFRRVAYPVERTQAEIRERGLPPPLAERLAHGV
jgi:diadenosine tetraphosphatase ApaH/serine/threonine PP2A family protein phosphatase